MLVLAQGLRQRLLHCRIEPDNKAQQLHMCTAKASNDRGCPRIDAVGGLCGSGSAHVMVLIIAAAAANPAAAVMSSYCESLPSTRQQVWLNTV